MIVAIGVEMAAHAKGIGGVREQVGDQGVIRHGLNESHAEGGCGNTENHVVVRDRSGKVRLRDVAYRRRVRAPLDGKKLLY